MSFEHALQFIAKRTASENNRAIFGSSYKEWSHNQVLAFKHPILSHVMFPRDLEGVNTGLLVFQEQIEKGYTFVSILLAESFRALEIARTFRSSYLECCVLLLQVRFLEHQIACQPFITKGFSKRI